MKRISSRWPFAPDPQPAVRHRTRRNTSIGGLAFAVEVEGEHVPMRISERALRQCFGARRCGSTWLDAYRRNAGQIDARAIAVHRGDPARPVFLDADDFR